MNTEMLLNFISFFFNSFFFRSQYIKDKGYCEDLTEGKFSFPIIHAIMSHPDDHQVIRILLYQISSLADPTKL